MSGIVYSNPTVDLKIAGLVEEGYQRLEPVSHSHPKPQSLIDVVLFRDSPPCANGEMWLFRKGSDLKTSHPESDQLLCTTCGRLERAE